MDNQTPEPKKPIWKRRWFLVTGGLILLGYIGIYSEANNTPPPPPQQQATKAESTPTQPTLPPAPPSLEEQIKGQVGNIGATKLSYMDLEIEKTDPDRLVDSKMITVKVAIADYWSHDAVLKNTSELSTKIFKTIYASDIPVADSFIWYYGEVKDRYGNTKQDTILTYSLNRTTYDKINWDNFNPSNLCEFLKQESNIVGLGQGVNCIELVKIQ